MDNKWESMRDIAQLDLQALKKAEEARKFDRIEHQAEKHGWDIFEAGEVYKGEAGLLDDIRDLRRYLILVEEFILDNSGDINNEDTEEESWDGSTGSEEQNQQ